MFFFVFLFKWYVTRKEQNSQTILITNDTLYISPLHAEDCEEKHK